MCHDQRWASTCSLPIFVMLVDDRLLYSVLFIGGRVILKEFVTRAGSSGASHLGEDEGHNSEDEEEDGQDTEGDDDSAGSLVSVRHIVEFLQEELVIGLHLTLQVVQWEGNSIDWVQTWEWSWGHLVVSVELLLIADEHVDGGFESSVVGVSSVWLHNDVVVGWGGAWSGNGVVDRQDSGLRGQAVASIASQWLLNGWKTHRVCEGSWPVRGGELVQGQVRIAKIHLRVILELLNVNGSLIEGLDHTLLHVRWELHAI